MSPEELRLLSTEGLGLRIKHLREQLTQLEFQERPAYNLYRILRSTALLFGGIWIGVTEAVNLLSLVLVALGVLDTIDNVMEDARSDNAHRSKKERLFSIIKELSAAEEIVIEREIRK